MKNYHFTRLCASWGLLLALFLPFGAAAQDCMCMGGTPLNPKIIHPDAQCEITLNDNELDDLTPCLGPFEFFISIAATNQVIASGIGSVSLDARAYLGVLLVLRVEDLSTPGFCFSYYEILDDDGPMLTCPPDTVTCVEFPANVLNPIIVENCGIVTLSGPVDLLGPIDCTANIYRTVFRDYSADDGNGNVVTCTQEVEILLSDTAQIAFPKDTILNCGVPFTTAVTGRPTLDGVPFFNSLVCNLQLVLNEDIDTLDCGDLLVFREWIILDECDPGATLRDTQLIKLTDTIPPVFTFCSPLFTFNANIACQANPVVPAPNVTDNCSSVTVQAILNNNVAGVLTNAGFVFNGLTEGTYSLTFIATDACGNQDTCQSALQVVDVTTPNAVCDAGLEVTLDNNGCGFLFADDVDDGSNDACGGPLDFKIRRGMTGTFEDFIKLNCADALLDSVLVTLQVIDLTNSNSTNICMVGVRVFDKFAPALLCPAPRTVDCGFDYSDLSVFGQPTVLFDPCGVTVKLDSMINIENGCGTGTITRMWTVTDPSGNESFCTQIITVQNQTPYNGAGIIWPADYTATTGCTMPSELEPTDLPAGFDEPIIPGDPCAMIATSYKDQLFYIDFPACYKIVRTWKVVDWCHATDINGTVGVWTDQQVIAVMDNTPPTITSCPANGTFGLNAACTFAQVNLTAVTATGVCPGEDILITNNSPYANSNGANASGNYPEGVHTIRFTVTDGCGNKSECSVTVTVADQKPPSPVCKDGIIAELQFMANANPEIMAVVPAWMLNYNSSDNCTAANNLTYTMRRVGDPAPPTAPQIVFDCSDVGTHNVEIWVTDESGNSDFCVTEIHIQDNMLLCTDDEITVTNGSIGGGISTVAGAVMPNVQVTIPSMNTTHSTDVLGKFAFDNLATGNDYSVRPGKNDDPKNGVTTYDIVLITRHILNMQPINDPYKLIAADVNNSGTVTTFDVVELRKLVLGTTQQFSYNTSWRFVKKGYVFPNPATPANPAFPEVMHINHFTNNIENCDFVGVKIGDINGSATAGLDGMENRSAQHWSLVSENRNIAAGEVFDVTFRAEKETYILALQFTLEFDTDLELQGVEKGTLASVAGDRFVTTLVDNGIMTGTWYHTSPVVATTEDALFTLRFSSKKSGILSDMISLTSRLTQALAYDEREAELNLNLAFSNPANMTATHSFELLQNQPNPFKRSTTIGFTLPETGPVKFHVYDLSGQVVKSYDGVYQKGYNEINIMRQELPVDGVLFYKLQTATNSATKKMILLQ